MEYSVLARLRGIDKWPFVKATVVSVQQLSDGGRAGWRRRVVFEYRYGSEELKGAFRVDNYSSVYELSPGDTFDIQCNPRKPASYFCEEAKSLSNTIRMIAVTFVLAFIALVIVANYFR